MEPIFLVYFTNISEGITYVYHTTKKFYTTNDLYFYKGCHNIEYSKLTQKYLRENEDENIEDLLKEYHANILKWRKELLNCKTIKSSFDILDEYYNELEEQIYRNNDLNIMRFFSKFKSKKFREEDWDKIEWAESLEFEKTNNGALQYCCNPNNYNCIGYDMKMAYPNGLSSNIFINEKPKIFKISSKAGKKKLYKKLNYDALKYGLYNIKISSDYQHFNKMFHLNRNNWYCHYEIEILYKYKEEYNIQFELITDVKYNAYIYEEEHLIDGKEIFDYWLGIITKLKMELPTNGLIKQFSSSIWGYLSKKNKIWKNEKDIEIENIKFDYNEISEKPFYAITEKDNNNDGTTDYLLIDRSKPYTKNYRLKPFITGFQRSIMFELIHIYGSIDSILRINTDNITYNLNTITQETLNKLNNPKICVDKHYKNLFIEEEKTSGNLFIKNVNNITRI